MDNKIKILKIDEDAQLPEYSMECDVALDIRANETLTINSMEQKEIRTGIAIEIPAGHIGLIRDRVGVVTKLGTHVIAGTIDPSYRGELTIIMINFAMDSIEIEEGMRIAQLVVVPVNKLSVEEVNSLSESKRTGKKFGSTGMK